MANAHFLEGHFSHLPHGKLVIDHKNL